MVGAVQSRLQRPAPYAASVLLLAHPRASSRSARLLPRPMGLGVTVPSGRQAGCLKDGRDRRSLRRCRSGSQQSKERASEPEVDAGEVRLTLLHPSFHRSWGKRRRRQRTNPGSSRPPGPILKMGATAQATPQFLSGPAIADQIEPSGILRKGEADDLWRHTNRRTWV